MSYECLGWQSSQFVNNNNNNRNYAKHQRTYTIHMYKKYCLNCIELKKYLFCKTVLLYVIHLLTMTVIKKSLKYVKNSKNWTKVRSLYLVTGT